MTTTSDRMFVRVGDEVRVETHSGAALTATVASIETHHVTGSESTRRRRWSRWAGTPRDLIEVITAVREVIEQQTGQRPGVNITIYTKKDDAEEHYSDLDSFERDLTAIANCERGNIRLRDLRQLEVELGPAGDPRLSAKIAIAAEAPALTIETRGVSKIVVTGLRDDIARLVSMGSPRVPAPNQLAMMILGGIVGFAYFSAFNAANLSWIPEGAGGDVLFFAMFFAGYILALYGLLAGLKLLLPPLVLVAKTSEVSRSRIWLPKAAKAIGALVLALTPLMVERIFFG